MTSQIEVRNIRSQMIAVTHADFQRIQNLLQFEFALAIENGRKHLAELINKLKQAEVVESRDMLPDIITMNSTFKLLDLNRNEMETYTIVYPDEACISEGKLSILSPLGAHVLGRRVGDTVEFHLSSCEARKRVEKISFQPERIGAFNL